MRYLTRLFLVTAVLTIFASCVEQNDSSATFTQGVSFEMSDHDFSQYFTDSLMFVKTFSLDQLIYFNASCDGSNEGFKGGSKISALKGGKDTPEDLSVFASADEGAGYSSSLYYLAFLQTAHMPDSDISLELAQYKQAESKIIGFVLCNSLYNSRLVEQGLVAPGDYLRLKVELYRSGSLVSTFSKDLVDYTGAELMALNEWTEWDISEEGSKNGVALGTFDSIKFRLEVKGNNLKPCFCMDNFFVQCSVTY